MTSVAQTSFTKKQLFAQLSLDGISGNEGRIHKAKIGDADAMNGIGYEYQHQKQQYDKAMAWYRLAAAKKNWKAQNNIGFLYHSGKGVPVDYLLAIEWYLKAAIQCNETTCNNIGTSFEYGRGVPINKYKALEWYYKSGRLQNRIKSFAEQGIHLTQQDKDKSLEELIIESEDIVCAARKKTEDELREENKVLQKEIRAFRVISDRKKEEYDSQRALIDKHDLEIQTTNSEINTLKQLIDRLELKMEAKDDKITLLENDLKKLRKSSDKRSQSAIERIEEVEKSNKNLRELLEKERMSSGNIEQLTKQKAGSSSDTKNQKKDKLFNENQTIEEELDIISPSNDNGTQDNKVENNINVTNGYHGRGRGSWRGKSSGQGKHKARGRGASHNMKPI